MGTRLLLIAAALIFFGAAQRVLERIGLTDSQALIFIALMIGGRFITIPLKTGISSVSLNLGGGVVTLVLVTYLLSAAASSERIRALWASFATAGIVYGVSTLTDFNPSGPGLFIDPLWLYSIIAGIIASLAGRFGRASFIAAVLGLFLVDLLHLLQAVLGKIPTRIVLGGAGIFDAMVLSGLIALGLAELMGQSGERIGGGGAR